MLRWGVDSAGFPTGSVQSEVYPPNLRGYRDPEARERFALDVVEPVGKLGGRFVRGAMRDIGGKRGRRRG